MPKKRSNKRPRTEAGEATPTPQPSPILSISRSQKAQKEAGERVRATRRARQRARGEFSAWKRRLCEIIQMESRIEMSQDELSWRFVLPAKLSRFFFEVMVNEYQRVGANADRKAAIERVRADIEGAALAGKGEAQGPQPQA